MLKPARCGTVSRSDRDFLQFKLKSDTKEMFLNFSGDVRLRVDVPGRTTVELTPTAQPPVDFVPNGQYSIEVTSFRNDGNAEWRVEVVER